MVQVSGKVSMPGHQNRCDCSLLWRRTESVLSWSILLLEMSGSFSFSIQELQSLRTAQSHFLDVHI